MYGAGARRAAHHAPRPRHRVGQRREPRAGQRPRPRGGEAVADRGLEHLPLHVAGHRLVACRPASGQLAASAGRPTRHSGLGPRGAHPVHVAAELDDIRRPRLGGRLRGRSPRPRRLGFPHGAGCGGPRRLRGGRVDQRHLPPARVRRQRAAPGRRRAAEDREHSTTAWKCWHHPACVHTHLADLHHARRHRTEVGRGVSHR
mmetsp:Transcript_81089/g.235240  ORF Transcript_81089/g.235240 Transcript_81089/m.235240 type:complete len:202 (-) Transcript_81089:646-1251(-)